MTNRNGRWAIKVLIAGIFLVAFVLSTASSVAAQQWVASWGSSLQGSSPEEWTLTDATIRLIARSTISGDRVRVRLENTFGEDPLTIGAVSIGLQNIGPSLVSDSNRTVQFNGSSTVTIPAGEYVVSDAVTLIVQAEQGLAVSLFIPGSDVRSSIHRGALTTSYVTESARGDQTANSDGEVYSKTTPSMHWLSAVEIFSSTARGAVVAFGDSITDGSCATTDGHDRWEDVLYTRLLDATGRARLGMINAGIGGNTAIRVPPVGSIPGVERLDRDVFSLAGVTHVIVFLGTNDIRRNATADQVIAGLDEIVGRAKTRGLKVIAATIIARNPLPRRGLPPELGFGAERNTDRHAVNQWIRVNENLDAVLDFDAVVRDPIDRNLINSIYDCDGIHPNVFGYAAMGRSIDLSLFSEGQ